jgi:hypothetical protein
MFLLISNSMRLLPGLLDAVVVTFLLATGFSAGFYTTSSLEGPVNQTSTIQKFPQGELKQESAVSSPGFIQAPYTKVNSTVGDNQVEVEVSAVALPEGKSMRPTIFSDNMVLLEEYQGGEIREGQILRYSSGDGHVIHRVQANYLDTSGYLLMKGDNNDYSTRVEPEKVTHRVLGVLYTSEKPTVG